jgi:hypothetical protein
MSLILCQIQSFITIFWNCPLLPKFSQWQILLVIVVLLGFPFCLLDPISSSHDCITIQLYLLQPCSMPRRSMKGIAIATAPVTSSMRSIHVKDDVFNKAKKGKPILDGWALIPDPAPNIADQISQTLLEDFISTHDPS